MDERKAGITTGSWEIVAPSFYPADAQLQAAEKDVETPWTGVQTHRYRKVFAAKTKKVWTIPVSTPLDGTIGVSVLLPKRSQSTMVLTSADGRPSSEERCARGRGRDGSPRRSAASARSPCA